MEVYSTQKVYLHAYVVVARFQKERFVLQDVATYKMEVITSLILKVIVLKTCTDKQTDEWMNGAHFQVSYFAL